MIVDFCKGVLDACIGKLLERPSRELGAPLEEDLLFTDCTVGMGSFVACFRPLWVFASSAAIGMASWLSSLRVG